MHSMSHAVMCMICMHSFDRPSKAIDHSRWNNILQGPEVVQYSFCIVVVDVRFGLHQQAFIQEALSGHTQSNSKIVLYHVSGGNAIQTGSI